MTSPATCGQNTVTPCCHLQDVLNNIQEGDTIYLKQMSPTGHSFCNQTREIQAKVMKSFVLETATSWSTGYQASLQGVHGLHLVLNSRCSQPCSVTIHHSHFYCSWVTINNMDIWIEDSKFRNSFITLQSDSKSASKDHTATIINTKFKHGEEKEEIPENTGVCEGLNYICVSGTWNSVEILHSRLQGDRTSQIAGLRVVNGNLQSLNLVGVQGTLMFAVLVVSSSSIDVMNVTESRFVSNKDGIDIGQGVSQVIVSNSEFNDTGSRFEKVHDTYEQCSAALKGSVQTLIVQGCLFVNNQGYGLHCKGPALHLQGGLQEITLSVSNDSSVNTSEHETLGPTIKIIQSVFIDNRVSTQKNSHSEDHSSGGAVAILGQVMSVWIKDCVFEGNMAYSGGGLYVSLQGRQYDGGRNLSTNESIITYSGEDSESSLNPLDFGSGQDWLDQDYAAIQDSSGEVYLNLESYENNDDLLYESNEKHFSKLGTVTITIENCTFYNNTAIRSGGGLMIQIEMASVSSSNILIIINSSLFSRNKCVLGHSDGGGLSVNYYGLMKPYASVTTTVQHTIFHENEGTYRGGGMFLLYGACEAYTKCSKDKQASIMQYASVKVHVHNCHFISNEATWYGAIFLGMHRTALQPGSFVYVEVFSSIISSNRANVTGGGVHLDFYDITAKQHSSVTVKVSTSSFMSNVAKNTEAGLSLYIEDCKFQSNSSFILETSHSSFTSNKASSGAALSVWHKNIVIMTSAQWTQQVINCSFLFNEVELLGAGFSLLLSQFSLHSGALHQTSVIGCTFSSNLARAQGAGISINHRRLSSCAFGHVQIVVQDCLFSNNTAFGEGGSLYFHLFSWTDVSVISSVFQANIALPGACIYRENIPACQQSVNELKTQGGSTTLVTQCLFTENIDTAIMLKSQHIPGTLSIKHSAFSNNWCNQSQFAEDVFTDVDLKLYNITLLKDKYQLWGTSINGLAKSVLQKVTVHITQLPLQKQVIPSSFAHYITPTQNSSMDLQCPVFFQPILYTAGLTKTGALMVGFTCNACLHGYYHGNVRLLSQAKNGGDQNCYERDFRNRQGLVYASNSFCHTKATGICIECPHGANCSAGVVALPNYWGHMTTADRLEFHRCPVGYCCNQAPCKGIAQCAADRESTLCGQCMRGFTESLLSTECIPDEMCQDSWILPLFCLWTLVITFVIIFSGNLSKLARALLKSIRCSTKNEKAPNDNKTNANFDASIVERDGLRDKQNSKLKTLNKQNSKPQASEEMSILWGILTMQRLQDIDMSGSHKYLQILLYYLQDASLMKVDLALGSDGITPIQKARQMLLNISQLAVDLIDLGLNLCPISGWTPAQKLVAKNLTGVFVFSYILTICGIVKILCRCFKNHRQSLKVFWYPKLTAAAIFSLLLFYQQIANVTFSLLYCIKSGERSILFIDGTVTCYQPWQILAFVFAFNWVVGMIPVLMVLPGLLELQMVSVSDFFLACLLPGPMLLYWAYRLHTGTYISNPTYVTKWQNAALSILQKTFVKTTYKDMYPFCWIGFMKIRRLALVLIFTFVSNLVGRVSLMCCVILLFLLFHLETKPYQDDLANTAYTASLVATLSIGFTNIMKAACVEFYLDLNKVSHFLTTLDMVTDGIIVYCPLAFIVITIISIACRRITACIKKKRK